MPEVTKNSNSTFHMQQIATVASKMIVQLHSLAINFLDFAGTECNSGLTIVVY